jgi:hypothetical protein
VGAGRQRAAGHHPFGDEEVVALQRVLVAFGPGAHVDEADAEGGRFLGHAQVLDQPGGVPGETRVIGREPMREDGPGPDTEVRRDRRLAGEQNRKQAAERLTADTEQVVDQPGDPGPGEYVDPAIAVVLLRLPFHERAQDRRVAAVGHETEFAGFAAEPARLTFHVAAEPRGGDPELLAVRGETVGEVDHRRGHHGRNITLERCLAAYQMIELPFRELARSEQFSRAPVRRGCVDEALTVGQAGAYRHADAKPAPLEREKPGDRLSVG